MSLDKRRDWKKKQSKSNIDYKRTVESGKYYSKKEEKKPRNIFSGTQGANFIQSMKGPCPTACYFMVYKKKKKCRYPILSFSGVEPRSTSLLDHP